MTNLKTTKRALLSSMIALVLCFTMLLGTTFAWFTDSVTSTGNVIKSGTLDVELYYADGKDAVDSAQWATAKDVAIFDYDKWEPGYTVAKHLKVSNEGTLDLKYQLAIVPNGDVSELAEVIDVYYIAGGQQIDERTDLTTENYRGTLADLINTGIASGNLYADGAKDYVATIVLKMQETAGNEYQNLSIGDSFSVKLFATQLTSETDGLGDNLYDAMATIDTVAELNAALATDYDLIMLGANIELTESLVIPADKTVTIDLCGYKLHQAYAQTTAYAMISNKGTLTIMDSVGSGKISYQDIGMGGEYASNTIRNEGVLTVNGGIIENTSSDALMSVGYPHAIDVYQGSTTTINGGTVKSANYDSIRMFCNSDTLATTVNINGGIIVNRVSFQDPASSRAGYGVLNISGGNFITTDGVSANVRLLNFSNVSSNMKATVTGGTFDKGVSTQDYANCGVVTSDWLSVADGVAIADVWNGTVPTTMPRSLVVDGATQTIHVEDAAAFAYLSTLSAKWAEFYTDGQGTQFGNYANGAGADYYYSGKWTVVLEFDINLNNKQIDPVTLEFGQSTGASAFDGKNHTIKNAVIKTDSTTENGAGLFNPSRCTLKNLKLDNIHVTGSNVGNSTAGILAGDCNFAIDNITITNSSVTGGKYTGGVIGYGYTDITNCTLTNVTVKGGYKLGGLIGYICASSGTGDVTGNTLTDCTVDGIGGCVYAGGKDKYIVGKVVGNYNCDGTCNNNTITNMTTSATENIGEIEAGKTVNQ